MRVLRLVLAGVLALTAAVGVQAGSLGPGWYLMPDGWDGDCRPSGWACCLWQGVPTFWVWGPSGGAFDYPFSDWRGPTGGWGNP